MRSVVDLVSSHTTAIYHFMKTVFLHQIWQIKMKLGLFYSVLLVTRPVKTYCISLKCNYTLHITIQRLPMLFPLPHKKTPVFWCDMFSKSLAPIRYHKPTVVTCLIHSGWSTSDGSATISRHRVQTIRQTSLDWPPFVIRGLFVWGERLWWLDQILSSQSVHRHLSSDAWLLASRASLITKAFCLSRIPCKSRELGHSSSPNEHGFWSGLALHKCLNTGIWELWLCSLTKGVSVVWPSFKRVSLRAVQRDWNSFKRFRSISAIKGLLIAENSTNLA